MSTIPLLPGISSRMVDTPRLTQHVRFSGAPHMIYADEATGVEEWMTFFEDGEGNTLALMARVPPRVSAEG